MREIELTNLAKAITEQPPTQLSSTAFNNPTGLLVIITPTLGTLPPRFYNHDSRVQIINVPTRFWNHDEIQLPKWVEISFSRDSTAEKDSLNLLAEISDGMSMVDIRNMAALSRQSSTQWELTIW